MFEEVLNFDIQMIPTFVTKKSLVNLLYNRSITQMPLCQAQKGVQSHHKARSLPWKGL